MGAFCWGSNGVNESKEKNGLFVGWRIRPHGLFSPDANLDKRVNIRRLAIAKPYYPNSQSRPTSKGAPKACLPFSCELLCCLFCSAPRALLLQKRAHGPATRRQSRAPSPINKKKKRLTIVVTTKKRDCVFAQERGRRWTTCTKRPYRRKNRNQFGCPFFSCRRITFLTLKRATNHIDMLLANCARVFVLSCCHLPTTGHFPKGAENRASNALAQTQGKEIS